MSGNVNNEEIDRTLSGDDGIAPSSGFASSVMEAVRRDAEAPPPIPFPWKRALPGLIVCVAGAAALLRMGGSSDVIAEISAAGQGPATWILVAVVVTLLSVAISIRMAGRKA